MYVSPSPTQAYLYIYRYTFRAPSIPLLLHPLQKNHERCATATHVENERQIEPPATAIHAKYNAGEMSNAEACAMKRNPTAR